MIDLLKTFLPWAPNRQCHSWRLDIDEERLAVRTEGYAGELFGLEARQNIFREIENLPVPR